MEPTAQGLQNRFGLSADRLNGVKLNPPLLSSFSSDLNVAVVGAAGGLGSAFVDALTGHPRVARMFRLGRSIHSDAEENDLHIDFDQEHTIADSAARLKDAVGALDMVIVTTGILHDTEGLKPEKTWRALSAESLDTVYRINTIGPALVAKHFLPLLTRERKSVFAALSARVGSIEDNKLGGWHAYRMSKAALNMLIKTLAVELAVKNSSALCVGLHPGTVDTSLSAPFQANVPDGKLFSPAQSAGYMLNVINGLSPQDSGNVFAWDGERIPG